MVRWKVVSPEVAKCAGMRDPLVDGHDVLLQLSRVACLVAADLGKDFFNVNYNNRLSRVSHPID